MILVVVVVVVVLVLYHQTLSLLGDLHWHRFSFSFLAPANLEDNSGQCTGSLFACGWTLFESVFKLRV